MLNYLLYIIINFKCICGPAHGILVLTPYEQKSHHLWPLCICIYRWFGHVEHSSGAIRTACDIQIEGRWGAGRPKLTWKKLTEKDCREWKLTTVDPQERSTWRSGVRSAMRAASQLPGKGPTDVDDTPAPAR